MQDLEKVLEEIGELRGQAGSECTSEDHYIKKAWEHCLCRKILWSNDCTWSHEISLVCAL